MVKPQTDDGRRRKLCHTVWAPWNNYQNPAEGARRFLFNNFETFLPVPPTEHYFLGKHCHGAAFGTENINVSVLNQIESLAWGTASCLKCKAWRDILNSLVLCPWYLHTDCNVKFGCRPTQFGLVLGWCAHSWQVHSFPNCCLCDTETQSCATLMWARRIMFLVGNMMIHDMLKPGLRLWCGLINSHHSILRAN